MDNLSESELANIRLEIVKTLVPIATRNGITEPDDLVKKCTTFENYVVGSESKSNKKGGDKPAPSTRRNKKAPKKG